MNSDQGLRRGVGAESGQKAQERSGRVLEAGQKTRDGNPVRGANSGVRFGWPTVGGAGWRGNAPKVKRGELH